MKNGHTVHFREWVHDNQKTGVDGHNQERPYVPPSLLELYWDIEEVREALDYCGIMENAAQIVTRFLRIFSTLVYVGQTQKITLFTNRNRDDFDLPILDPSFEWKTPLRDFWDEQWMFCPLEFSKELIFKRELHTRQILPVTYGESLGDHAWAGNGPSYEKVQIHPECNTMTHDTTLVFKIFKGPEMKSQYKAEAELYARLPANPKIESLISKHYGSFSWEENDTRIIILEYAAMGSLLDFFRNTLPPVTTEEFEMLWRELLKLVSGLHVIHTLGRPGGDGESGRVFTNALTTSRVYWDIQPANILVFPHPPNDPPRESSRFDVRFKLADLRLAEARGGLIPDGRFKIQNEGNLMYSAPECYSNYPVQVEVRSEVGTNVDVWALGAVYSEVLVWSISGEPGRDRYQVYRKEAIKRLGYINNKEFEACFHDGEDVLAAVKEFHDKVLQQKRENDSISEMMSRFILEDMLRKANSRLTTNMLIRRANRLIETVQREAVTGPSWSPLQAASTHGP
ncbi:kinase-like domain-containing protein, partial [Fusarium solani]